MTDRLTTDMRATADKLARRADGYRLAGAKDLASRCLNAAARLREACETLDRLDTAERAARKIADVD